MYGVTREHAPNRPMQIMGLAISALVTVGAANLMMSGFGNFVGAFTPEITTLATIPEKETQPPPPDFKLPDDEVKLPPTTLLTPLDDDFVYDEEKKETAITGTAGDDPRVGDPEAVVAPPKAVVRIAPKMRTEEIPPYPGSERRAQNEGNTSLGLCIDARGRVTSANLARSSGHPRLDEAALEWVKDARFSPGTVDGAAQAVCGHTVVYEWRLEDAR